MKRPDKYPAIDPRAPGIYRRILDAAAEMRSRQQAEAEIGWIMARARISAKATAVAELADADPVEKVLA